MTNRQKPGSTQGMAAVREAKCLDYILPNLNENLFKKLSSEPAYPINNVFTSNQLLVRRI